jgi:DNA-binding FadR family transcriptional regulator
MKEGRLEQSLSEHREIVQALSSRQPELAAEMMSTHFMNGLQAAQ